METNPTKQVMERNRTPGIELWNRVTQNQEPLDGYGGGFVLKKKGGRERGIMGFVGKRVGSATAINGTCAQNS